MNCSMPEKSMIWSSLRVISCLRMPRMAPFMKMFSRPVSSGWKPVPTSSRLPVLPCMTAWPRVGSVIRLRIFSRVVLPAPLWPMTPSACPFWTSKLTSFKAQTVWVSTVSPERLSFSVTASRRVRNGCRYPSRYCFPNPSTRMAGSLALIPLSLPRRPHASAVDGLRREVEDAADGGRRREAAVERRAAAFLELPLEVPVADEGDDPVGEVAAGLAEHDVVAVDELRHDEAVRLVRDHRTGVGERGCDPHARPELDRRRDDERVRADELLRDVVLVAAERDRRPVEGLLDGLPWVVGADDPHLEAVRPERLLEPRERPEGEEPEPLHRREPAQPADQQQARLVGVALVAARAPAVAERIGNRRADVLAVAGAAAAEPGGVVGGVVPRGGAVVQEAHHQPGLEPRHRLQRLERADAVDARRAPHPRPPAVERGEVHRLDGEPDLRCDVDPVERGERFPVVAD